MSHPAGLNPSVEDKDDLDDLDGENSLGQSLFGPQN